MLVMRNRFVCKPGNASKFAAKLKDAIAVAKIGKHRVLTDVTGEFNQVILESELKDLLEFDAMLKEYETSAPLREKFKGYTEFWARGSREIFQVV
jgi:hypothetical protein